MSLAINPSDNLASSSDESGIQNKQKQGKSILKNSNEVYDNTLLKASGVFGKLISIQNSALGKVQQFKDSGLNSATCLKNTAIQKLNSSAFGKYTDESLNNVLFYIEEQLKKQGNYEKTKTSGKDQLENSQQLTPVKRMQNLSVVVFLLAKFTIQDGVIYVQALPATQKLIGFYHEALKNPQVQEIVVAAQIARELILNSLVNYVLAPSISIVGNLLEEGKRFSKLTISDIRTKAMKEYIPLVKDNYVTLQNGSVQIYKNCMEIEFTQDYAQKNSVLIYQEVHKFYIQFLQYQEDVKSQCIDVYKGALENYKQRRSEKISYYGETKVQ